MTHASTHQHKMMQLWLLFFGALLLWFAGGVLSPAFAQVFGVNFLFGGGGFHCVGSIPVGRLFDNGGIPAGVDSSQVFTFFVLRFEEIMSEIYSNMFCGMQAAIRQPLIAVLTLFVAIMGGGFLLGVVPFTGKDLAIIFFKFALVLTFSTQADLAVGLVYTFLVTSAREGIDIVLSTVYQPGGGSGSIGEVFGVLDNVFNQILTETQISASENNKCQNALFAFLALVLVAFPPLFALAFVVIFKLVVAFIRAVFGYLFALLGITFLLTLLPIFASFALFGLTKPLFDKYVGYLISFAFQMLVVFAFFAMILSMDIYGRFGEMFDLVVPIPEEDSLKLPGNTSVIFDIEKIVPLPACTICKVDRIESDEHGVPRYQCALDGAGNKIPLKASELRSFTADPNNPNDDPAGFYKFMGTQVMLLAALAYLIEGMLAFVPQMARYLGGNPNVAQLGGSENAQGFGARIGLVGEGLANTVSQGFQRGYNQGAAGGGTTAHALAGGFSEASASLLVGQRDPNGQLTNNGGGIIDEATSFIGNAGGPPVGRR